MNINEIIIDELNKQGIEFRHPYNIDYRVDTFDIDFYLIDSKTFIILEYDTYNHEIYEDIKALGSSAGYKTTIIPIHEINNEAELRRWITNTIYQYK